MTNKLYAVGLMSFLDNELEIEFIIAESYGEAFIKHSKAPYSENELLEALDTSDTLDEIELETLKELAFDNDALVDIKLVPGN